MYNRGDYWDGYEVCVNAENCYYWWENNIVLANRNIVPTKPEDKKEIPAEIR